MIKKIVFPVFVLLLLLPIAYSLDPISRTDQIIKEEHEKTRAWCKEQWDSKEESIKAEFEAEKEQLMEEYKTALWWERIASFVSLLAALVIGYSLNAIFTLKRERRRRTIDNQKAVYDESLPPPPKPGGENETGVRKVRFEKFAAEIEKRVNAEVNRIIQTELKKIENEFKEIAKYINGLDKRLAELEASDYISRP